MKKLGLFAIGLFLTFAGMAQQAVTATNILGKWKLYSVQQAGMFDYEIKSQKVIFDTTFSQNIAKSGEITEAALADTLRLGLASLSGMGFEFLKDGKSKSYGADGSSEEGTYELDEKQGILTVYGSKTESKEVIAVKFVAGLMEMSLIEPEQPGVLMRFAKE